MDSVVFVDDSDFELELIRTALPVVTTIQFPVRNPLGIQGLLTRSGLFDSLTVSVEDRKRGEMYLAERARKTAEASSTSLEDYFASLEMVAEVRRIDEFALPRATQLTQKTNQFNLTTRRYAEDELRSFIERDSATGLYIRVQDRFGDYGIVGVALLEVEAGVGTIDSFLLSCRALGRGVEDLLLAETLAHARALGAEEVVGRYLPTAKNRQTEDFYPQRGFVAVDDADEARYTYSLMQGLPDRPGTFKEIHSDLEEA